MGRRLDAWQIVPAVVLILGVPGAVGAAGPETVVEDVVATCRPPGNGAGPLWCYGAPLVVRQGDQVFVSAMETGEGVPPLCNTRWRLFRRDPAGWREMRHDDDFRQREPCPLIAPGPGKILLSVNPSTEPRGTKYGRCDPQFLVFDAGHPDQTPTVIHPAWDGKPRFTDHSYRGLAADAARGDVLALNIDAVTSLQHWSFRAADGASGRSGSIGFPIRACYPQVALRDRAAHVMAIGDIVEPNEAWRTHKKQRTGADWDYVFRRLFYTWSPDIAQADLTTPVEIDSVDPTGGHIANLDLWIDGRGVAHLLYLKTNIASVLRDRYFPGKPIAQTLEHVEVERGRVVHRSTLLAGGEGKTVNPLFGRFHATMDGSLLVVAAVSGTTQNGTSFLENRLIPVENRPTSAAVVRLKLREPFTTFFTAAERGGNHPSDDLDLFGTGHDSTTLRYAHIRLK